MTNEIRRWVIVDNEGRTVTEPSLGSSEESAWQVWFHNYNGHRKDIDKDYLLNYGYRAVEKVYKEVEGGE